jgi:hypothetical protein
MNCDEYYCDFTIDKNYILAYNVSSKKLYKLFFDNWKIIYKHLLDDDTDCYYKNDMGSCFRT